ncbi:hypothetical protein AYI70_g7416 [Smittium culicis]|uniref:NADH dehydrogenase [ubiquinone] 1 beta subcomplex subunit 4 n=1 Tax=Smittium culicis TaxID=133412 RepID=A0A1R1X9S6_9FUNG|nr:hypothetical protein AYI70_g9751 [Smittium culicis]OMJ15214.1 hypothetical protein AYI70_g7416 [Smittium culicis]
MAGGDHKPTLLKDPAIEQWLYLRANYKQHFKFTRKTVTIGIIFCGLIPYGVYTMSKRQRGKYILEPSLRESSVSDLAKLDKSKWTSHAEN